MSAATVTNQTALPADGALLEAARLGDDTAFEALFERYFASVYTVSLRVLGSPEDAEEIALDVFMKLHKHPLKHLKDGALGGWLHRTALNASFNNLRARKRRLRRLREAATLHLGQSGAVGDPVDAVVQRSEVDSVRRGLAGIPEKQRNALVLRSHGFQYSEIASALEIAPSSVGTTLARAERALRKQLENEVEL